MTKISITIPVYNVEKYLPRCLNSIIGQPFSKECEIICVDDGSTDNSRKILEYYENNCSNVKVIHQENQGLSEARNTAMKYVTGKYTMFVDSDDFLIKDSLEKLYNYAESHNADVTIFDFLIGTENLKNIGVQHFQNIADKYKDSSFNASTADPSVYRYIAVATWNKFYLTNLIKDLKFEHDLNNQDVPYWSLVYTKAERVHYFPEPFYYYTTEREGAITQTTNKKAFDVFRAFSITEDTLRKTAYFEKFKSIHYAHFTCNLVHRMRRINPELRREFIKRIKRYKIDINYDEFYQEDFYQFEKDNMKIIKFIKENSYNNIDKMMKEKHLWE